jgi:hypothetical protein
MAKASRTMRVKRYLRSANGQQLTHRVPAGMVFAVAAYQSYLHTVEVTRHAGEGVVTSHMMPLSVDGLMIVAARYVTHAKTRWGKLISFVAFVLGVAATLAANIMAADDNTVSRVVAVWPAVALVFTAGMLHWGEMRPRRKLPVKANIRPLRKVA